MVLKSHTKHKKITRKRKHSENESEYERIARGAFKDQEIPDSKKLRPLLPIKSESGTLINQFLEEEEVMEETESEEQKEHDGTEKEEEKSDGHLPPQVIIQQKRISIAKICANIINDPQNNYRELKKLQQMMGEKLRPVSLVVRKLSLASLTCVLADIIPGYRIRERTEEENAVKLSKEVRSLVEFEEGLLHHYQIFLQSLEKIIKKNKNKSKDHYLSNGEQLEIRSLAVKSLCELYEKTPHFNYHNNIVMVLIPLLNDNRKEISDMCCNSVKNLFRSDKSGEATLATIKVLCRLIKDQSGSKRGVKPEVLDTFLSLRINQVDFDAMSTNRKKTVQEKRKEAAERKKLSRGQLKHLKRQQKLQQELKETEATEKRETKIKHHTEIIQQVFLVYFRILKQKKGEGRPEKLLNSVLEGLAQFAHLINVDFFSDLIVVLQNLIASNELTHRQSLCCISTAFKVLSGQGEVLNIDPTEFYKHLYKALFEVINTLEESRLKRSSDTLATDLKLMMDCLNLMLNKRRRQVSLDRLLAFIKRLTSLSLHLHPASDATSVLDSVVKLLRCNSKTNSIFDIESQEKGVYLPELDDPEHCGASSACLWELHLLSRHCSPMVKTQADGILRDAFKEQQLH